MKKVSKGSSCNKCPYKIGLCVVVTNAGGVIVQSSVDGKKIVAPLSKRGRRIIPMADECLGRVKTKSPVETFADTINRIGKSLETAVETTRGVVRMRISYANIDATL